MTLKDITNIHLDAASKLFTDLSNDKAFLGSIATHILNGDELQAGMLIVSNILKLKALVSDVKDVLPSSPSPAPISMSILLLACLLTGCASFAGLVGCGSTASLPAVGTVVQQSLVIVKDIADVAPAITKDIVTAIANTKTNATAILP